MTYSPQAFKYWQIEKVLGLCQNFAIRKPYILHSERYVGPFGVSVVRVNDQTSSDKTNRCRKAISELHDSQRQSGEEQRNNADDKCAGLQRIIAVRSDQDNLL